MSTIRINSVCTEFGRSFTVGQVVEELGELEATAMAASGLARFLVGAATRLPDSGVIPITSVQFANPAAYGFNIKTDRIYEFNGGRFHWGGTAFIAGALSATQATQAAAIASAAGTMEVYAQPDASGVWADRPAGLVINVPTWARFLNLSLCSSGGAGGSGRRQAAGTARSGGGGGQPGVIVQIRIPLRDSAGALLAPTATLTCGASPAGGAAVTTDATDGNSAPPIQNSSFVFAGVSYSANSGGTPAFGGAAIAVNASSTPSFLYPNSASAFTSISGNVGKAFANGPIGPGAPGGSISSGNLLLTTGGMSMAQHGGVPFENIIAGADGFGQLRGSIFAAVGGAGGASSITAAAQAGGNGIYGSGGGGGGASGPGFDSGAGGRGGAGWAVLLWE